MARKIELEVQLEGIDQINKDLDKLETSLKDMKSQLSGMDAGSAEFKQLSQAIQETETKLNSFGNSAGEAAQEQMTLNAQIGEAEDKLMLMAAAGDTSSAAYKKLLGEVGAMKKVQMDTNVQIDRAAAGFTGKLTVGVQRAAAAFQVGMAAQQMFGVESEKATKIMAQLQAVMAFTSGIEQLKQLTVGMSLFGKGGIAAMSGLKKAITATGIGALVVAVGTIVAYWDDIVSFITGGVSEQEKLVDAAKENVSVAEKQLTAFDNQTNQLKLQGKSEKEILELRIQKIDAIIKEQEVFIATMEEKQKMEVANAKRNQEITEGIIRGAIELSTMGLRLLALPIDLVLETANEVAEALGFEKITTTNINKEITKLNENLAKTASTFLFDPDAVQAEGQKAIDEQKDKLDKLKSDRDGLRLQIKQIEEQEVKNSIDKAKERAEKLKELRGEELEIIKQMEARRLEATEAGIDQTIAAMEEGADKQIATIERAYGVERQAMIDRANENELKSLDEKFVNGTIKEEEYLNEVRKLRADDSRLTEEERKLLIAKETQKNSDILKIETDAAAKKAEVREKYLKFLEDKETDQGVRARNAAERAYQEDLKQLKEFLDQKAITQAEYDAAEEEAAKRKAEAIDKIDEDARNKQLDRLKGAFSAIAGAFDQLKTGAASVFGAIGSSLSSGLASVMEIGKQKFDEFDTAIQNTAQKVNAYAQAIGGMLQSVLGAVSEEQQARLEENLTRVQETYDAETAALEQQKKNGEITEEEFAKRKYQIDLKRFNQEEALRKKAFEQEKGMKIASAIIAGLQGAVAAFAGAMQLGPIAGPIVGGILAGVVGLMTAANVAQIAATQYKGGTPPSAPSITGGAEGAGGAVSGAMTAPTPATTTLFGAPMTQGNQGGQGQELGARQQPMRAYVLESDITTSQNTISTYEQRAEIG